MQTKSRRSHVPAAVAAALALMASAAFAQENAQFDLPAQSLVESLRAIGKRTDTNILIDRKLIGKRQAPALKAELSVDEALKRLLEGTGLKHQYVNEHTVTIVSEAEGQLPTAAAPRANAYTRLAQAESASSSEPPSSTVSGMRAEDSSQQRIELEEILVTGTHIRGAQPSSPMLTITEEEMRLAGHANLGDVIRALPQNFSGGQNPGVATGASIGASAANVNVTGASSLNLRGLGPDATLTLLNGTRFSYDGLSQGVDVSVIPLAAIERVEVLLDGASAIYGSDAVGGVANILLRRDYEGAELSARFGGATDGGYDQQQYTGVGGTHWGSGGFLIAGDYSHNDSVKARHRDYLGHMANQSVDVYPESTQKGTLFSGHQNLGESAQFALDAFYTERSQNRSDQLSASSTLSVDTDSSIWGLSPSLDFALPGDWSARLHGAFGRNEAEFTQTSLSVATGAQISKLLAEYFNGTQAAGLGVEGPLFALPGGEARVSLGGGYRRNSFDRRTVNLLTGTSSGVVAAEQSSDHVYGEVHLPLMTRLSLNAALRHENYDSFGASTTPKIGVIWGLVPGFELKASWGRSFKIPTLVQQHQAAILTLYGGPTFGGPMGSQVLYLSGGNPDLDPEEAEIITAGIVARPEFVPGLTLEFGYFDIDYTDRVAVPIDVQTQALRNPVYAEFATLDPTTSEQNAAFSAAGLPVGAPSSNLAGAPYDPSAVIAIVDNVNTNVSNQRVKGFDVVVRYAIDLFGGDLSLSGNGNWITDGTRRLTDLAPVQPAAGVNYWPAKFKGRLGAGWSRQGFTLSASVYHIAGITDRNVTPNVNRDSMTTLDLVADYQWDSDLVGDVGFNLAVTNVFDEEPPFLQPLLPTFLVNYDSTNYSALGRVISATISKRF